jgi:hypothetical protein
MGKGVSKTKNVKRNETHSRFTFYILHIIVLAITLIFAVACTDQTPQFAGNPTYTVTILADNQTRQFETELSNVRELLESQNISLGDTDEVDPPLFTPLSDNLTITIVRITESVELIDRGIPFGRQIVRSEAMTPDDPPVIIQGGKSGLEQLTVRITYRDGIEAERRTTLIQQIEPSLDEIVMIGVGAESGNVTFDGILAFNNGGNINLLRGNTAFPEQIRLDGQLDGRVFKLSPTGSHLLYTLVSTNAEEFNSLHVRSTEPHSEQRDLGIVNVLWADWNPAETVRQQIGYSTGIATGLPPGWEANNDLWVGDVLRSQQAPFIPQQLIETYPATYGWWGGNYEWSPSGRYLAYAHADEVGIIDLAPEVETLERVRLQRFTEFNTGGDWVWVPSLSWSPDGRLLAFTNHAGISSAENTFDSWVVDVANRVAAPFVRNAGMWAHPHWSNFQGDDQPDNNPVAYLQATTPLESERSTYTLWLMDQDGSNKRQIFPTVGENSRFPREAQFMAWGPSGQDLAFIFSDNLYIYNVNSGSATRINQDDAVSSDPTWAPYGAALVPDEVGEDEVDELVDEDTDPEATPTGETTPAVTRTPSPTPLPNNIFDE